MMYRISITIAALACAVTLVLGIFGAAAASANAKRGLMTGLAAESFNSTDEAQRAAELDGARAAAADFVRVHVQWRNIAPEQPANPRNPADPAYDFATLDAAILGSHARGLKVVAMIRRAPGWAEGKNRPPVGEGAPAGTWKPCPGPAKAFGRAIAKRYSGSFPDPADPDRMLPRLRYFQIWNEPNLSGDLTPQWEANRPTSALVYRRLLNAFYRGIKSVDRSNVVVTAGTGPYGDHPGGVRLHPLRFWRAVMCLRPNLRRASCPKPKGQAHFDVLAHHPINTSGGPFRSALHPDDASTPDMWKLRRVLRAAERSRTIRPGGRRPLWATEVWIHPDVVAGNFRKQARWLAESLYLFWSHGVSVAINFLVRDTAATPIKSGVYTADGTKKPSFTAFRFPFVAFKRGRRVELWGMTPRRGTVVIGKRRRGKWRRVTRVRPGTDRVFHTRVRMRGKPGLQARMRGERSLVYKVRPRPRFHR